MKTKKRKKALRKTNGPMMTVIPVVAVTMILVAAVITILIPILRKTPMADSGINYTEGTAKLLNPGRGQSQEIGGLSGLTYPYHQDIKIYEFSMSLGQFTSADINNPPAGKKDAVISAEWLANLRTMFDTARAKGAQAFCVFSYGTADAALEERKPVEPLTCVVPGCAHGADCPGGMHTVLYHIEQLSSVMNDYPDVLLWTYSSMLGAYGEQHSTPFATRANLVKVVDKWFECTSEHLPHLQINVRGLGTFVDFYNSRHGTKYTDQSFHMMPDFAPGTDEYRLGLWNDVFNNDYYDMGTFWDREQDTEWLSKHNAHAYYGGETANGYFGKNLNEWNAMPYFEYEAFKMNTSWLRRFGDDAQEAGLWSGKDGLYPNAKGTPVTYYGSDPVYNGKVTTQQYIERHLGYRFVVRSSMIQKNVQSNGKLRLSGEIENVGFGNILINYRADILIADKNGNVVKSAPADIDLNSGKYDVRVNLPEMADGEYSVYLKLNKYSGNGHTEYDELNPIMFANVDMYDGTLRANRLGSFSVNGSTDRNTLSYNGTAALSPAEAPAITGVTIPRRHSYVILERGDTYDFTAVVTGTGNPPQTVKWALAAGSGSMGNSAISAAGRLTVGSTAAGATGVPTSYTFKVTATAGGKTATAFVKIRPYKYNLSDGATGAALDGEHPYTFSGTAPLTVRVTNTGTAASTHFHFLQISGESPDSFTLTGSSSYGGTPLLLNGYASLGAGKSATFTVQPKPGLAPGTYRAVIAAYGTWENWDRTIIPTAGFAVTVTVN